MNVWVVIAVVVAIVIVVGWYFASFNTFVRLRNLVDESWHQVDVELQRRHDLVPNLVAVVERAADFQRDTLTAVVDARARAIAVAVSAVPSVPPGATPRTVAPRDVGMTEVSTAENGLTSALDRLRTLAENYPQLTAVRNYEVLQRELADTEDRIAASRRLYNANVRALNTKVASLPSKIVASAHHVATADYFEITEPAVRQNIDVASLFGNRGNARE